jgi:flagellar motor switch protein FliM
MVQKSPAPPALASPMPRHALEGAEASGARIQSAVRRVAGRIAAALNERAPAPLCFAVASIATGRRDAFDDQFAEDRLSAALALDPLHLPAVLLAPQGLAALLVERHYGGRIEALGSARMRAPGRAEVRELTGLAEQFAAALQHSCEDRLPVQARVLAPLAPDDAQALIAPGEAVAAIRFDLAMPPASGTHALTLLLPLAALRATSVLQVTLASRDDAARRRWREDLAHCAGAIAMPARSVIARPMLSMSQLMALRPGDVIPIRMPRQVPLLVADRRVATGTIGERDGRVAFMIDQLEREDAQ